MSESNRLRWKCRRGMLELDLLLNAFLEREFPQLPITEQQHFQALLEEGDETLWAMISDVTQDVPAPYVRLLESLRACSI